MCNRSSAGRPVRVARELDEGEKRGRDCGGLVLALTLGLEFDFVLGAALDLGAAFGFEPTLALVDVGGVGFARLVVLPVSRVPTGLCLACGSDASLRGRFCERSPLCRAGYYATEGFGMYESRIRAVSWMSYVYLEGPCPVSMSIRQPQHGPDCNRHRVLLIRRLCVAA
jgi:hypothetical protein